ncbi:alginate lyase family protein [Ewingella sp. S1.OA.A_B6]
MKLSALPFPLTLRRYTLLALLCTPWLTNAADFCSPSPDRNSPAATSLLRSVDAHLANNPDALPHLHTEGTLLHRGIRDESEVAEKDLPLMRDAALAWRLNGDSRYLNQTSRYLAAWVNTYQPSYDPIDETHFESLIIAYSVTQHALAPDLRNATQTFLRQMAQGYVKRIIQAKQKPHPSTIFMDNWQSHRIKLVTMIAFVLDDKPLQEQAKMLFKQQTGENINADGSVFDFYERDALHYVVYDLEPLTMAALAAARGGQHWSYLGHDRGGNLAQALDWLVSYADGRKTHQEYQHSSVPFDAARREAGEHGFSGPWAAKSSQGLYWMASHLDSKYKPLAQQLAHNPPAWLNVCWPE